MKAEEIKEGYLVRGTVSPDEAWDFLSTNAGNREGYEEESGRYRKVPGQWSNYVLYPGQGRGSFEGVIFRRKR